MKRIISVFAMIAIISTLLLGSIYAEPGFAAKFKDVEDSDWYAEAVGRLNALEIIDGLPGGIFSPKGEVTRAQFIKMLVQAMNYQKTDSLSFDDLKPFPNSKPHWATVYIETALRNGVISKDEIGSKFFPDVPIKREDMFMMMYRALNLTPSTSTENPFYYLTEINGEFTKLYEEYLVRGTIIEGKRIFNPLAFTTRAEAAVVISRMLDYKENPQAFKDKMAAEDNYIALVARIKAGNYTEEDLIAKGKIEIEKQKADKTYIPEPILKVDHVNDATLHARITLLNYRDYNSDFMINMNCTNYPDINSMRTNSLVGLKSIEQNVWKDAKRAGKATLFDIIERNGKFVGDTCEYFSYKFKSGTTFNFKVSYKRNTIQTSFVYTVTIK